MTLEGILYAVAVVLTAVSFLRYGWRQYREGKRREAALSEGVQLRATSELVPMGGGFYGSVHMHPSVQRRRGVRFLVIGALLIPAAALFLIHV